MKNLEINKKDNKIIRFYLFINLFYNFDLKILLKAFF